MAGTSTPIFPQTVKNWALQYLNATGTTKTALVTGGTNGSKVEILSVSSTDTVAQVFNIYMNDGTISHLVTCVNIPASSGNTSSTVPVDIFRNSQWTTLAVDTNGNRYLYVASGWTLQVGLTTGTVTSGKIVDFFAHGGDF
jgi:hypothetical protein